MLFRSFKGGKQLSKKYFKKGNYPVIGGGQKPTGYHNKYNRDNNTILCSSSGAYSGFINRYKEKIWASDCFSIQSKDDKILNENFLYMYLKSIQNKIYKCQSGTAQPHVYSRDIKKLSMPLPPLKIQYQIENKYNEMKKEIYILQQKLIEKEKLLNNICNENLYQNENNNIEKNESNSSSDNESISLEDKILHRPTFKMR